MVMAIKSGLTLGVLVGIADILIYQHFVPGVADVRQADAFNPDIESAERKALLVGTAFTVVVAGFARSAEVFAIGGIALVSADFAIKHANAVNPQTGKLQDSGTATSFPMPDYSA
jgi:hypothetical protein